MAAQLARYGTKYSGVSKALLIAMCGKAISSAYRKDLYSDPLGFVEQVGRLLEYYSDNVLIVATDPVNVESVQRRYPDAPPSVGQIAAVLDAESERQFRMAKAAHEKRPRPKFTYVPLDKFPGCRANVFVDADAPQYQELREWSESEDADSCDWRLDAHGRPGIHVALGVFENLWRLAPRDGWKPPPKDALRESLGRIAGRMKVEKAEELEEFA
jgi:hypothetical protein